jgi:alanyl-tRNA synthetase
MPDALPPTVRLYDEPLLLAFESEILDVRSFGDRPSLVLAESAFYPEGGGQPGDRGALVVDGLTLAVVDVQVDDGGVVHHLLATPPPASFVAGRHVSGTIERARRRDFMSQHTGQHLLSAGLMALAGAETVSSRLGESSSTIDVARPDLTDEQLSAIEDWVNDIVLSAMPITVAWPTPDALASMPLRRAPKVTGPVRVVAIGDVDLSPCGGTHCTSSGQIGPIRVTTTERHKGGTRVEFLAGARTLAYARREGRLLDALARDLGAAHFGVGEAVDRLRATLGERTDALARARGTLLAEAAARLLAAHPTTAPGETSRIAVDRTPAGDGLTDLRALTAALAARPDVAALVASRGEAGWTFVVGAGAQAAFDAGKWVKETAASLGGRGGGRPDRAEGKLPPTVDWETLAARFSSRSSPALGDR